MAPAHRRRFGEECDVPQDATGLPIAAVRQAARACCSRRCNVQGRFSAGGCEVVVACQGRSGGLPGQGSDTPDRTG